MYLRRFPTLLLLAAVALSGCGSGPPKAALLSWRTTREPLKTVLMREITPEREKACFVLVTLRVTGWKLFHDEGGTYSMTAKDFQILSSRNSPEAAVAFRRLPGPEGYGSSIQMGSKPAPEEDVEVVFAVDQAVTERSDLLVRYEDLPEVPLDPKLRIVKP
jgi:hypothetical protein